MPKIKSHGRGKRKPSTGNSFNDTRPMTLPVDFRKPKRSYTGEQLREMRRQKGVGSTKLATKADADDQP